MLITIPNITDINETRIGSIIINKITVLIDNKIFLTETRRYKSNYKLTIIV